VLLLVGVLGVSCGDEKPQPPANRAPTVNSLTAQPTEVASGGTITLALDASDPDGNELTYTWKQEPAEPAGAFSSTRSPVWTAPHVTTDTFFVLSVTVADGKGGTDSGSVTVKVLAPGPANHAPVLSEGPTASPDSLASASPVELSVTATDADNDALTYAWTQAPASPAGTFNDAASRTPTWVAPTVTTSQLFTLKVTISDGKGGSVQGEVAVTVNPSTPDNAAPVLSEGPTAAPASLKSLEQTQLSVTATDAENDSLTYTWLQEPASPAGTFSDASARLTKWTAPTVGSTRVFTLKVVISDGNGGSVQGQVDVTVAPLPTNQPPVITAGPSASPVALQSAQQTQLSVSASDEDPLTYTWTQEPASPAGTFSDATSRTPSWTAPTVSGAQSFLLKVTVSDGRGGSIQGQVQVDVTPPPPPNHAPVISAGPTASPSSVVGPVPVQLTVSASDEDGDTLAYAWTQEPASPAGSFSDATVRSPTWTAPTVSSSQTFTLKVTVSDGKGGSVQGQVDVTVAPPVPANQAPAITAGPTATPASLKSTEQTQLAVTATDADNDSLSYTWTQEPASPAGTFSDASARTPSWTAPTVSGTQTFTFRVTVSDGRGGTAQGQVDVTVAPLAPPNQAPVITEGPTATPASLQSGNFTQLGVTATDADGDALTYAWTQEPASPAGSFSSTAARTPTWKAPTVSSAQTFTLKVTVSDGRGGSVQGQVDVTVNPIPPNHAPTITAGPSASASTVPEQQSVDLSVTAADEDNDTLSYLWSQVSPASPQGAFSSTSAANPTWTAPDVNANTVYTLRVTILDGRGGSVQGTVDVTVQKVNRAPNVGNISSPTTLRAGDTGSFSVTATDPDGDALTYAWTQTAPATQGTFVGGSTASSAQWYSPSVGAQTSFTLSVSVTDGQGEPVVRTVSVPVTVPRYTDVQSIWSTSSLCTGCHGSAGGLNLGASSYANLVNVNTVNATCNTLKRVTPGDPNNSSLVRKLEGTTCGTRMPSNNPSHFTNNPGQLVRIRSWILAGASND
jgi:hypothetical protein